VFAQTSNPNSRGTQVFINLKDNTPLDRSGQGFAPFGIVDGKGMNVVEMMYDGYGDSAGPDQERWKTRRSLFAKRLAEARSHQIRYVDRGA